MSGQANREGYFDRIATLLKGQGPEAITHTIERISEEVGTSQGAEELRDPSEWQYAEAGRPHFDAATRRNLVIVPHTDERGREVAVSLQLATL